MIMKFSTFLLEGRGINNELKQYIDEIEKNFFNEFYNIKKDIINKNYKLVNLEIENDIILSKYLNKIFIYNLDYTNKELKISEITFNCDIYIGNNLEKYDIKKNHFSIDETNIDEDPELILNPVIHLTIFINEPLLTSVEWCSNGFMSSILHELHHVFQFWLLITRDQDYTSSMIKAVNINRWYKNNEDKNIKVYDLYYRLYLSRPHEITARNAQLYQILNKCNTFSLNSLIDTVKHSNEWKLSLYIESFSREAFLKNLQNSYTNEEIIEILSELFSVINKTDFIQELDITYDVLDMVVINKWLKQCEKYFKSLGPKIREHLLRLAKEAYNDKTNFSLHEKNNTFKILI